MCCFSGAVRQVTSTRIFARHTGKGRQFLVYSMKYNAPRDVAMILPLPVSAQEKDPVNFISLQQYAQFFEDVEAGFPRPPQTRGLTSSAAMPGAGAPLPVVEVGDFIASYVPSVDDFDRLDPQFAIPTQTWKQLPLYHDYGFAVFKLKAAARLRKVQPMSLSFATRYKGTLFFPTVHIHDGKVHPVEMFDHALYWQYPGLVHPGKEIATPGPAKDFVKIEKAKGIVDGDKVCYKREIYGKQPNQDILVRLG
jgi:hypothetical protein